MTTVWLEHGWAASVRGGGALLLAWGFSLLPRVPAAVRCWAWRAAYAALVAAFIWTTPIQLPIRHPPVGGPVSAEAVRPRTVEVHEKRETASPLPPSPASRPGLRSVPRPPLYPAILFTAWLAFLGGYTVRLTIAWTRAARLRHGRPIVVPDLAQLCDRLGVAPPPVRVHPAARSPLLVGLLRPLIVLPDPPPSPAELPLVLAHELAHLKRRDLLWNWLPTVAFALLPLHPLVWVGHRRWRLAAESAADAAALAATSADPAAYGRLIVTVATRPQSGVLALAAAAESRWLLKQRLSAMAHSTHWNRRRLVTVGMTVAVIGTATAVPWRVVAQPTPTPQAPPTPVAVKVRTPIPPTFSDMALGTIAAPTAALRVVSSGTVAAVKVQPGSHVRQGDVLVELDAHGLAEGVALAEQVAKTADERAAYLQQSYNAGLNSIADVQSAKLDAGRARESLWQRRRDLEQMRIVAPFDGTMGPLAASPGSTVMAGETIATVIRTDHPTCTFTVAPERTATPRPGDAVTILTRMADSVIARGTVTDVDPTVDAQTQTVSVHARLTNATADLWPGAAVVVGWNPAR